MDILNITCREDRIVLAVNIPSGPAAVRAFSPASCERLLLGAFDAEIRDGAICVPRQVNGRDGLTLRWEVEADGKTADGRKYVEELGFSPLCGAPYPTASSKKGLQVSMIEDAVKLGVKHAAQNVCIGDFMRPAAECAHPIFFPHDGAEYVFDGDPTVIMDYGTAVETLLTEDRFGFGFADGKLTITVHNDVIGDRENDDIIPFRVEVPVAKLITLTYRSGDPTHGAA